MGDTKLRKSVVVANPNGLHARPADLLCKTANKFKASVAIIKGSERVDAKSILGILTLAAMKGTELTVETEGNDAQQALDAVATLLSSSFEDEFE
jgi:phosphotransferase system HPr (HPr) family protein